MFVLEEDSWESSIEGWLEPLEVEPQAAHILQSLVSSTKVDGLARLQLALGTFLYEAP